MNTLSVPAAPALPVASVPAAPPAGAVAFGQKVQRALQALVHKMAPPQFTLMNIVSDRWRSDALGALARLGVADALGTRSRPVGEVAAELSLNAEALYRVLRALARDGLLTEAADRHFALNALSAPLRRAHPQSMANFVMEMSSARNARCWARLPDAVRTGAPVWSEEFGVDMWTWLDARPEEHAVFHGAMLELTREGAPAFARGFRFSDFDSVVDLGGGTGLLLANILAAHPTCRGVLVENPTVLTHAPPVFARYGVGPRVEYVAGDLLAEEPPPGKGVYVLKHILHGVDDGLARTLLARCRAAMRDDSRLVAIEVVVPETPSPYLGFLDLQMLLVSHGGRERTRSEFAALFASAGLTLVEVSPTASPFGLLVAKKA